MKDATLLCHGLIVSLLWRHTHPASDVRDELEMAAVRTTSLSRTE